MHITTKGQITIPRQLREKFHIRQDTSLEILEEKGKIVIQKSAKQIKKNIFEQFRGIATVKMTTDEIMKLTRG